MLPHSIIALLAVLCGPVHRPLLNRLPPAAASCATGDAVLHSQCAVVYPSRSDKSFVRAINLRRVYFFRRLYS